MNPERVGRDRVRTRLCVAVLGALALSLLGGCRAGTSMPSASSGLADSRSEMGTPQVILPRLHEEVQPEVERYRPVQQASTLEALSGGTTFTAAFKRPALLDTLTEPWSGLMSLERYAHDVARGVKQRPLDLPAFLQIIEGNLERPVRDVASASSPSGLDAQDHLAFMSTVLNHAGVLREEAMRTVDPADRRFLFDHGQVIVRDFIPQVSELDDETRRRAEHDLRFASLVQEQLDVATLVASARVLAALADENWLAQLGEAFDQGASSPESPQGMTGEILWVQDTPSGRVVIGGAGPNRHILDSGVALLIDLGGDDVYVGTIAAASAVDDGNRVVIDVSGNDSYHASALGLATGRLGVGLLIDRAGDDRYHLASGSGGIGLAGVGILVDMAGNDQYSGAKLTQGAAVGGVGLLIDMRGHDRFTSFGYSIGFAGPVGEGLVIDAEGRDRYKCGDVYSSSYNANEAPESRRGDPLFQYDGFCLGVASGKRILTKDPDWLRYGLAGGRGLLLDLGGDDRYESANFSQGTGYFFGTGAKLDLGGDDHHRAARYGYGAGAHYGVGLFIDSQGTDHYNSTGPVYNGATAWDRSVALCVDAGAGHDVYDLTRSDGLGRADHHSWSIFIDDGGEDQYRVPYGMGTASDNSLSGFFDLGGTDEYVPASTRVPAERGNGRTLLNGSGGLFVDR